MNNFKKIDIKELSFEETREVLGELLERLDLKVVKGDYSGILHLVEDQRSPY